MYINNFEMRKPHLSPEITTLNTFVVENRRQSLFNLFTSRKLSLMPLIPSLDASYPIICRKREILSRDKASMSLVARIEIQWREK